MRPGIFVSRTREKLGRTLEPCYTIPVTPGDYAKVFGAISPEVCMLFKHQTRVNIQQWSLPNIIRYS